MQTPSAGAGIQAGLQIQPSGMRWLMISLAFLATVINYLDRQTLSVAAPVLRKELNFGDIEYSRIVFAFMLAYTIMNGVSGPLIDRLGTRRGYALCMLAALLGCLVYLWALLESLGAAKPPEEIEFSGGCH